jgi:cysteinyl-tRNA synthetase, unknown class
MKTKVNYLFALALILLIGACGKEKIEANHKQQMRNLIKEVAQKARCNPGSEDFLVIVQNAPELAYDDGALTNDDFLAEVDGFTGEWVFYNGTDTVAADRLAALDGLAEAGKWVLALDYVNSDSDAIGFMDSCRNHEFIGYPRILPVEDYSVIPTTTPNANSNHILQLSDAQNALVAYNPPADSAGDLLAPLQTTDFDVLIIDPDGFTKDQVDSLKFKAHGGRRLVIAYLNLGAAEEWRYYFDTLCWRVNHPDFLRCSYPGFEKEYYVKYWKPAWHKIIYCGKDPYIDRITAAGFDGVILDNADAFLNGKCDEQ